MMIVGLIAVLFVPIVALASSQFVLESSTFAEGGALPLSAVANVYGCTGKNLQPEMHWVGAPVGTKSFALIMRDPDAPVAGGFWHWVVFNIPASETAMNAIAQDRAAVPWVAGTTSTGSRGYVGPCPPPGKPHHYVFTLYALDITTVPGADVSTTGPALLDAIKGHVVGRATITGLYGR